MFAIPKNNDPWCNTFRRIDHLSHPSEQSVNDCILKEDFPVSFVTIDEIAQKICGLGRGCLLAKEDLSNAYKQLRLNPSSAIHWGSFRKPVLFFDIFGFWRSLFGRHF